VETRWGDVLFWENMGSKWKTDVGPQMEMSSLVLTIQLLGYLILTHTHMGGVKTDGLPPRDVVWFLASAKAITLWDIGSIYFGRACGGIG
jgi:hypothetical protein